MSHDFREVTLEPQDGAVKVGGDLVIATAAAAVRQAEPVFGQGDGDLVFDLAEVNHCDSAALAVLLEWRREASRRGRRLSWRNVPGRLQQLATISELGPVLQLDPVS